MKSAKRFLCTLAASGILLSLSVQASPLTDSLSRAASQLSQQGTTTQQGTSLTSLTGLLNGNGSALSTNSMNNAAGILQYCAKQKLANITNTENIKNRVLDKLGLGSAVEQKEDPNFMNGIQGLLNAQNGQQLDLNALGNTQLGKKVKMKACDLVLKQGAQFIS